jgi:hypothetical protein
MRNLLVLPAALALLAACATTTPLQSSDEKPSGREQQVVEMRAVVTGVDQPHRLLALQSDDGGKTVLPIAAEFRDFDKLRVGDPVVVSYTEAIAWNVKPAQEGAPGVSSRESLTNPKPGEAPGGAMERSITITAAIVAFDPERGTVTLAGPQGTQQTLRARNPADLEHVRVGDLVEITYSETRALALRPAGQK